jgi:hypothetical protein
MALYRNVATGGDQDAFGGFELAPVDAPFPTVPEMGNRMTVAMSTGFSGRLDRKLSWSAIVQSFLASPNLVAARLDGATTFSR